MVIAKGGGASSVRASWLEAPLGCDAQRIATEAEIAQPLEALQYPENAPFRSNVALPTLLEELGAWLLDNRQWQRGQAGHWQSLLVDLGRALEEAGSSLESHLQTANPSLNAELKACRRLINE